MKRIYVAIFVGILLWPLSCTLDQGEAILDVNAEIINIGHTILSIKYNIDDTVLFDDIVMKENIGILNMIKKNNTKEIPLRVQIYIYHSEDSSSNKGLIKYYYGANLLAESRSFDFESIQLLAERHEEYFIWEIRDGKHINSKKKAEKAKNSKKLTPTDEIPEDSKKL